MGLFGKIGNWVGDRWGDGPSVKGLKSTIKGVGNTLNNPVTKAIGATALAATGVGAPAAAAIMAGSTAAGKLAQGKNIGEALSGGLREGVTSLGPAALTKIPAVGRIASNALGRTALDTAAGAASGKSVRDAATSAALGQSLGGLTNRIPAVGGKGIVSDDILAAGRAASNSVNNFATSQMIPSVGGNPAQSGVRGLFSGGGSDGKGRFGALGDLAGNLVSGGGSDGKGERGYLGDVAEAFTGGGEGGEPSGLQDLIDMGMDAAQAMQIAQLMEKMQKRWETQTAESDALRNEAMNMARNDWNSRQQFRDAGSAMLLNAKRPDLSGMIGYSNPYTKKPTAGG